MKKIIILLTALQLSLGAQTKSEPVLLLSAGVNTGLLAQLGYQAVPFNIQADQKLRDERLVIGLAYSHTRFRQGLYGNGSSGSTRHNFRARIYHYFSDPEKTASGFFGGALGVSGWKSEDNYGYYQSSSATYIPTAQALLGLQVNLSDVFFWMTEIAVGGPYMCQSSLGLKF